MGVVMYVFRAELRRSLRWTLALALVLGLAGGAGAAALAAARRTTSALPRLVTQTDGNVVTVAPDEGALSDITHEAILELPQVVRGGRLGGMAATIVGEGERDEYDQELIAWGLDGRVGVDVARLRISEGRMVATGADDEVVIDAAVAARHHLAVGDTATIAYFPADALESGGPGAGGEPPLERAPVRVVGIGAPASDVASARTVGVGSAGRLFLAPGFIERVQPWEVYWNGVYELRSADDAAAFVEAVHALAPDEEALILQVPTLVDRFQRAVRPRALALAGFGALLGAVSLLFCGLALARMTADAAADRQLLESIGLRPRERRRIQALHGAVIGVAGAAVAAVTAIALSPLSPIGPARGVEPSPGVSVDLIVLVPSFLVSMMAVVGAGAFADVRARRAAGEEAPRRGSRAVRVLTELGAGPVAIVGASLAFGRGHGRSSVPTRSTLAIVGVAVGGVVALACFAVSLTRFVDRPAEHGVGFDLVVRLGANANGSDSEDDYDAATLARFRSAVDDYAGEVVSRPGVDGLSTVLSATSDVAGRAVTAFGIRVVRGTTGPVLVEGRAPVDENEAVAGLRTLRRARVGIGDQLKIGTQERTVVGTAVFPGYGEYGDITELGDALWLTPAGLQSLGAVFADAALFVDLAPGATADALGTRSDLVKSVEAGDRPADEVRTLAAIRTAPLLVAGLVGVLGVLGLTHALVLSLRRRRLTISTLAALGFTPRQLGAAVQWQATLVAGAGMLVGVPVGIAAGRVAWSSAINALGGAAPATTAWLAVGATAGATLALANLLALGPARLAARSGRRNRARE